MARRSVAHAATAYRDGGFKVASRRDDSGGVASHRDELLPNHHCIHAEASGIFVQIELVQTLRCDRLGQQLLVLRSKAFVQQVGRETIRERG